MPELHDTLTMLAERGDPIGPDAMATRVEAVLAERESNQSRLLAWSAGGQGVGVLRAGVALLVVVLLGTTIALLVGSGVAPIDEEEAPPTTVEGSPTTIAAAPNWVAPVGVSYDPVEVPGLSERLGPFVWTLVESDGFEAFPRFGVRFDPAVGYVSEEGARVWMSPDGYDWSNEELADVAWFEERYDWFELMGDYARVAVFPEDGPPVEELLRRVDPEWVPVDLPGLEPIDGVETFTYLDRIRVSGDSILVAAGADAHIAWEEIIDGFIGQSFEAYSERRLEFEVDGADPIQISVERAGTEVSFLDEGSGEIIHRASAPSEDVAAAWVEDPTCLGCSLGPLAWLSTNQGESFASIGLPGGGREIVGIGGGDFVYIDPTTGDLLTSNNGTWQPTGTSFPGIASCGEESETDYLNLDPLEGGFVLSFACDGSEEEVWASNDGVNWFRGSIPTRQPVWGAVREVEEGATGLTLEVSVDGAETWVELPSRPGAPDGEFSGGLGFSADGELVFVQQWRDEAPEHAWMWVGRFLGPDS